MKIFFENGYCVNELTHYLWKTSKLLTVLVNFGHKYMTWENVPNVYNLFKKGQPHFRSAFPILTYIRF